MPSRPLCKLVCRLPSSAISLQYQFTNPTPIKPLFFITYEKYQKHGHSAAKILPSPPLDRHHRFSFSIYQWTAVKSHRIDSQLSPGILLCTHILFFFFLRLHDHRHPSSSRHYIILLVLSFSPTSSFPSFAHHPSLHSYFSDIRSRLNGRRASWHVPTEMKLPGGATRESICICMLWSVGQQVNRSISYWPQREKKETKKESTSLLHWHLKIHLSIPSSRNIKPQEGNEEKP